MPITTADFDEIVLTTPFFTEESAGYGKNLLFWGFLIYYSPASLRFPGQDNSTCKYITITYNLSDTTFKIIREDDHIVIQEYEKDKGFGTITNPNKIRRVKRKIDKLKRIVKKDAEHHNKTMKKLGSLSVDFDLVTTGQFIDLLIPKILSHEKDQLLLELKLAGKNPLDHFNNPTDTIDNKEEKIIHGVFEKVLFDELNEAGVLFVIDWQSHFEEISDQLLPVFEKLDIPAGILTNKPEEYETTVFLEQLSDYLEQHNKKMVMLGGMSDTYLAAFTETKNGYELRRLGQKIKIDVRELKE